MAPDLQRVKSQDVCGYYGLEIRPFSGPERPAKSEAGLLLRNFEKLGVSKIGGPVAPDYATYSKRFKTFENWPIPDIQPPEKLADAGFYYMSTQDNVLCFHCGGGLKNWEADDDPWIEHALWFSKCGFVILQKGMDFIRDVSAKSAVFSLAKKESKKESETSEKVEKPQEIEISTSAETAAPKKDATEENASSASPTLFTSTSTESSQLSKNSSKDELQLCRICYTNEREIVFLPCGHFVSCSKCAPSLSRCAVCRKPFEAVVRAYFS